jgi:hypothetical protein
MKRLITLLIVFAVAGICLPAVAQEVEKTVLIFRTMDDPNIPPDPAVMQRAPFWNPTWDPYNPPLGVVALGYSTWSLQSSASDGEVVVEKIRQTGSGTLVAIITDPTFTPFDKEAPAYSEVQIGDLSLTVNGECEVTDNPAGGPLFLGCYMTVVTGVDTTTEGIKWGQGVSNSTFLNPFFPPPAGFETGSFWSVQLIWE